MDFYGIGELLIDFIPGSEPNSYICNAGGAPANAAIAMARNGFDAGMCCKVGDDDFGRFLIQTLKDNNVRVLCPEPSKDAVTTMAFVTLHKNGERTFVFARKPGADMMLNPQDVRDDDIRSSKIIHAGSCSLSAEPAASATVKAMRLGHEMQKIVSFDVNYRNLMWKDDIKAATDYVLSILQYVDLLKVSEEEVLMIGGVDNIPALMASHNITVVVETLGEKGARCYFDSKVLLSPTSVSEAIDTTGAGDAFWGGFLSCLLINGVTDTKRINESILKDAMRYGNISGGLSVQKKGAISSLPTRAEIEKIIAET